MSSKFSAERFIALYDIHCGFERRRKGTEVKVCATHNRAAIAAALAFARDFKPDRFILGGDQLNFAPISHWNKGKLWANEGGRIRKEMDLLNDLVLEPIDIYFGTARKQYMIGNHDAWLYDYIDEHPAIEGLIEPENYLNLVARKWEIVPQGEVVEVGKMAIVHGDNIKGRNPARSAMTMYGRNIRFGHHHTSDVYTHYSPADARDFKTAKAVPGLCTRNPVYGNNSPNHWSNGLHFGYVWPGGNFTDYVVEFVDSAFVAPGSNKLYCGKKLVKS